MNPDYKKYINIAYAVADPRLGKPSASGMARLCLCPGSWQLEQKCPAGEESEDAAEGTLLHAHMENGTTPEDEEQAELIRWCREAESDLIGDVFNGEVDEFTLLREERLWALDESFSGQADLLVVGDGRALVIDYKFGRVEVEPAESNHQLGALAVLVRQRWGVKEVYAAILQPRVNRKPQLVRYDAVSLDATEAYISHSLEVAGQDGARLKPGATQCKYCRALAECPAQLTLARQVTAADFLAVQGWELWDAPQKRNAYDVAKLAAKWARSVLARVEEDLRAGESIPGLEMGSGRTSFTITDAPGAFAILNRELGVSAAEFAACCKVGSTELHKLTHAKLKERGLSTNTKDSRRLTKGMLAMTGEEKPIKGAIKEIK